MQKSGWQSYKKRQDWEPPQIKDLKLVILKNELDGQLSSLLARMHVCNYKATFSPIHLFLLKLDTHRLHLDFKILDENNNKAIPRTFYL